MWVLHDDISFQSTEYKESYPTASLLGFSVELRQRLLVISYDLRRTEGASSQSLNREPRKKPHTAIRRDHTIYDHCTTSTVKDRIAELCKVCRVFSEDMQYVGKQWQHAVQASMHVKTITGPLEFPEPTIQGTGLYGGERQKGVVVQGDDRPFEGRGPRKC